MIIHGDGFLLRHHKPADIPALVKHANNKNISDNLRDRFPNPYTEKDAEWFINFASENSNPVTNFVIEINSEAAGSISFWPGEDVYRLNAEIGYWLGEEHWGKGIIQNILVIAKRQIQTIFQSPRKAAVEPDNEPWLFSSL